MCGMPLSFLEPVPFVVHPAGVNLTRQAEATLVPGTAAGTRLLALRHVDVGSCFLPQLLLLLLLLLHPFSRNRLEAFNTLVVVVNRVDFARLAPRSSTMLPGVVPGDATSSSLG